MLDRFVLYNARRFGDVLAFGGLIRQCRFDRLEASVSRLARALKGVRGLEPNLVAVQCKDSWRHWMLLLALGRLGLASVSLPAADVPQEMLAVLSPDLIILHDGDLPDQEGRLLLSNGWFNKVLDGIENDVSSDYFLPIPVESDTLCRVAVVTGTDRDMHVVGFSYSDIESSLLQLVYQDMSEALSLIMSGGEKPHLLCTISPLSISGFLMVGAALVAGTTVRGIDAQSMGSEVAQKKPLFVVLTPVHLEQLLKALPPGMKPVDNIYVTVVGAALSQKLLEKSRRLLSPYINVAYGIDECGLLSSINATERESESSVGRLLPWVSLEVVDDENLPLLVGEVGTIRLRSSGSVKRYRNESDVTQRKFSDGWFYPGDRGFISRQGELHLCGRVDEIVAIGGGKFDLSLLDQMTKEEPVVEDAAFFVVWNEEGHQVLYCALVTSGELNTDALSNKLRVRYSALPPITALWVKSIPYKDSGYVDRDLLKRSHAVHSKR